jgi:hypothetical protein
MFSSLQFSLCLPSPINLPDTVTVGILRTALPLSPHPILSYNSKGRFTNDEVRMVCLTVKGIGDEVHQHAIIEKIKEMI